MHCVTGPGEAAGQGVVAQHFPTDAEQGVEVPAACLHVRIIQYDNVRRGGVQPICGPPDAHSHIV